jgi:hypothetical protein
VIADSYLIPVDIVQVLLVDDRTSTVVATTPLTTTPRTPKASDKIGLTFQDWLKKNSLNLDTLCHTDRYACNKLRKIQKTGNGQVWLMNQDGQLVLWSFMAGKVIEN